MIHFVVVVVVVVAPHTIGMRGTDITQETLYP